MSKGYIVKRAERLRKEMAKTGTDAFVVITDERLPDELRENARTKEITILTV